MLIPELPAGVWWSIGCLIPPLFVAWMLVRISRNYGQSGAVLLNLGTAVRDKPLSWISMALFCAAVWMMASTKLRYAKSHILFEDFLELLMFVSFIVPCMIPILLKLKLCERGILLYGELIPWAAVTGWKDTPQQGLQIEVKKSSGWSGQTFSIPVSPEHAGRAAEILAQHVSITSNLVQPSVP